MKSLSLLLACAFVCPALGGADASVTRKIFVSGGQFPPVFITYVAELTGKSNPRICFLPTASGDKPETIAGWYERCTDLPVRPYVQRVFRDASPEQKTFEEELLSMDAIVVSGGNTLNMIAIWKAQGIDAVLRQAYEKGIVLAGSSAGSICWFTGGVTDSRPKNLSLMECLGFLPASHCPHYDSHPGRRPLYHEAILSGAIQAGYACEDGAGLLFENEVQTKAVTFKEGKSSYYVSVVDGQIREDRLESDLLE